MEQTKTMVLVPQDLLDSLRYNQREKMGPLGEQLVSLDKQMKNVLSQENLNDDQKAQLYFQTLQKFTATKDLIKQPPIAAEPAVKLGAPLDDIPTQQKKKAEKIFNWFKRNDITWNQKGEVEGIPGSNIADLVNELSKKTSKKQPKGFTEFAEKLKVANIPRTLVVNSTLWDRHFDDTVVEDDDIYTTPSPTPSRPAPYLPPTPSTPKRRGKKPSPTARKWEKLRNSKF